MIDELCKKKVGEDLVVDTSFLLKNALNGLNQWPFIRIPLIVETRKHSHGLIFLINYKVKCVGKLFEL